MSLFFAELRKVWGSRVFPALLAILAAANLLLLWMGTRPTAKQPPASAYRAVGAELSDKNQWHRLCSSSSLRQQRCEQSAGFSLPRHRESHHRWFPAHHSRKSRKQPDRAGRVLPETAARYTAPGCSVLLKPQADFMVLGSMSNVSVPYPRSAACMGRHLLLSLTRQAFLHIDPTEKIAGWSPAVLLSHARLHESQ